MCSFETSDQLILSLPILVYGVYSFTHYFPNQLWDDCFEFNVPFTHSPFPSSLPSQSYHNYDDENKPPSYSSYTDRGSYNGNGGNTHKPPLPPTSEYEDYNTKPPRGYDDDYYSSREPTAPQRDKGDYYDYDRQDASDYYGGQGDDGYGRDQQDYGYYDRRDDGYDYGQQGGDGYDYDHDGQGYNYDQHRGDYDDRRNDNYYQDNSRDGRNYSRDRYDYDSDEPRRHQGSTSSQPKDGHSSTVV